MHRPCREITQGLIGACLSNSIDNVIIIQFIQQLLPQPYNVVVSNFTLYAFLSNQPDIGQTGLLVIFDNAYDMQCCIRCIRTYHFANIKNVAFEYYFLLNNRVLGSIQSSSVCSQLSIRLPQPTSCQFQISPFFIFSHRSCKFTYQVQFYRCSK